MRKHNFAVTILIQYFLSVSASRRCEVVKNFRDSEIEISSISDYLEFTNKYIEKVNKSFDADEFVTKIDKYGNVYQSHLFKIIIKKGEENYTIPTELISPLIFIDKILNIVYVGAHDGVYVVNSTGLIKINVTDGINVDFGIADGYSNIYIGNSESAKFFVVNKAHSTIQEVEGISEDAIMAHWNTGYNNKLVVDSKNNIYIGGFLKFIYVLKFGETKARKIKDISGFTSIAIDSADNVYFRTANVLYVLKNDNEFVKLIETSEDSGYFLFIDDEDNIYFDSKSEIYVMKSKKIHALKVTTHIGTDGLYFGRRIHDTKNHLLFVKKINNTETLCSTKKGDTRVKQIFQLEESVYSATMDENGTVYFITHFGDFEEVLVILRKNTATPIKIDGIVNYNSIVFVDGNNNAYVGSHNGLFIIENGEITPRKLLPEWYVHSYEFDEESNFYFGIYDYGAYVLKSGELLPIKVEPKGFNATIVIEKDQNYDVFYLLRSKYEENQSHWLYKLIGGETVASEIYFGSDDPQYYLSDCRGNIYYAYPHSFEITSNYSVFELKSGEMSAKKIAVVYDEVKSMTIDSKNNIYFGTLNKGLQVLKVGGNTTYQIIDDMQIFSLAVDSYDNVYFSTEYGTFMLRGRQIIEVTSIKSVIEKIKIYDDNVYFFSVNQIYLYRIKLQLKTIFKKRNLGEIDNNDDETILNALNFLNFKDNYIFNSNKMKIIRKTSTAATIVAINGKYTGHFRVSFNLKAKTDNHQNLVRNIFDFDDLLKKIVFFTFINDNRYNFKKILKIDEIGVSYENLEIFPVTAMRKSMLSLAVDFKAACFDKKEVINASPIEQHLAIQKCDYEVEAIDSFQIQKGLRITNKQQQSVLEPNDAKILFNFTDLNNENQNMTVTLSNLFDLSNLHEFSQKFSSNFTEREQDIIIPPRKRVSVKYSVRVLTIKCDLNLKQKIKGVFMGKIKTNYGEEIIHTSIKKGMEILQMYSASPSQYTINQDKSITFNGEVTVTTKLEKNPRMIRNFYNL